MELESLVQVARADAGNHPFVYRCHPPSRAIVFAFWSGAFRCFASANTPKRMADEDFDIATLAEYLHLSAARVARMADRGQLPGRKVAGEWRFSPSEVHHWLEQRIGALDDSELLQLEEALQRARSPSSEVVSIADLLPTTAIAVPLNARTRSSVITSMVELAAGTGWLWEPERMREAVRQREDLHPTALDTGVALLHPRRPMPGLLAQPFLAFGRTSQGIPFSGNRGLLTDLFFLILSVDDQGHLRTLARLSRMLTDPEFMRQLRSAADAAAAAEAIRAREQAIADE